jgi:hypothetical protein
MPPVKKKAWKPRRCEHHFVWVLGGAQKVVHACAHCTNVSAVHEDVASEELLRTQCAASQAAHAASCKRPIR